MVFWCFMQVVIRRLPPSISKEQLEEQLHPLPAHDYFELCTADPRYALYHIKYTFPPFHTSRLGGSGGS